jgi:hypothetical protein
MQAGANGLALIRGQWVEIDRERLERIMGRFQETERLAAQRGLSFAEAMPMLAGADVTRDDAATQADPDWSRVAVGPWLAETLRNYPSQWPKQQLSRELLDGGAELNLTEMKDEELLRLVALDLNVAMKE